MEKLNYFFMLEDAKRRRWYWPFFLNIHIVLTLKWLKMLNVVFIITVYKLFFLTQLKHLKERKKYKIFIFFISSISQARENQQYFCDKSYLYLSLVNRHRCLKMHKGNRGIGYSSQSENSYSLSNTCQLWFKHYDCNQ